MTGPTPRPLFGRGDDEYGGVDGEGRQDGEEGSREGEWEGQQPPWQGNQSGETEQSDTLQDRESHGGQAIPPLFPPSEEVGRGGIGDQLLQDQQQQAAQPEPAAREQPQQQVDSVPLGPAKDAATIPGLGDLEKQPAEAQTHQVIASLGKIVSQLQTLQSLPKVQSESERQLSEETKKRVAALLANESDSDGEGGEGTRYLQQDVSAAPVAREFDGSFDLKPHVYSTYSEHQRLEESGGSNEALDDQMAIDREGCDDQRPLSPYHRPLPPDDMEYPPGHGYPTPPPLLDRPREPLKFQSHDYNHTQRYPLDSRPVPPPQDQWYEREQYRGEPPDDRPLRGEVYDSQPMPPEGAYDRYPEREGSIAAQIETIDYSHGALPVIESVDYNHGQPPDFNRNDFPPPPPPPHNFGYPPAPPAPVHYNQGPGPYLTTYGPGGVGAYPPPGPFLLQPGYFPPGFDPRDPATAANLYAAYAAGGVCVCVCVCVGVGVVFVCVCGVCVLCVCVCVWVGVGVGVVFVCVCVWCLCVVLVWVWVCVFVGVCVCGVCVCVCVCVFVCVIMHGTVFGTSAFESSHFCSGRCQTQSFAGMVTGLTGEVGQRQAKENGERIQRGCQRGPGPTCLVERSGGEGG